MKAAASLALALVLVAAVVAAFGLRPRLPAAERGRRLAQRTGCFGCHGEGGLKGAANPGREDGSVPGFEGDVMMYAKSLEEIRQWIHDGVTVGRFHSESWREQRRRGALKMPAFGHRLSDPEIADLTAYVAAVSGMPEPDPSAAPGLERAEALGCVGCHGAGGRLAGVNPGSLKGYVPSWESDDFAELVRDRTEFQQWVENGISERFDRNPFARWFLRRAVLHMPAYRDRLEPDDVDRLWAYVQWLRALPDSSLQLTHR